MILDTETTGLPDRTGLKGYRENPNPRDFDKYNDCRIVQLCFMYCNDNLEKINVKNKIIKREGFDITNSSFHGITNEISDNGYEFNSVIEKFEKYLDKIDIIIAHNSNFDMCVLKSELYRRNMLDIINKIERKIIWCSMLNTENIIKIKNPSLLQLYKFATKCNIKKQHDALWDVKNLHKALKILLDNRQIHF